MYNKYAFIYVMTYHISFMRNLTKVIKITLEKSQTFFIKCVNIIFSAIFLSTMKSISYKITNVPMFQSEQ